MILAHEKDISFTERYFFFSQSSNSVGKYEFLFQFTSLQPICIYKYTRHVLT